MITLCSSPYSSDSLSSSFEEIEGNNIGCHTRLDVFLTMMLAPRSFSYTTRKDKDIKDKTHDPEKRAAHTTSYKGGFGWRPASFRPQDAVPETLASVALTKSQHPEPALGGLSGEPLGKDVVAMRPAADTVLLVSDGGQTRSKPVAVPGKRRQSSWRTTSNGTGRAASAGARNVDKHDPNAMPASVAALLAMTSIPRKTSYATSTGSNGTPRRYSSQQLMDDWKHGDIGAESSLGTSPNMHVLLTPPSKADNLSRSSSEETIEGTSPEGSLFLESVPSLTADDRSTTSSSMNMSPRETFRRPNRQRQVSLSTSVRNDGEHPLTHKRHDLRSDLESESHGISGSAPSAFRGIGSPQPALNRKPTSFKSNLSSSISALRSTWKSLSNFASTPYLLPEDHLSRGLFDESRVIQREMRPRPSEQLPSAELRRYLNPSAYRTSPYSDFHYHGDRIEHTDYEHAYMPLKMADMPNEGSIIALQDRVVEDSAPQVPESSLCSIDQTEAGRAMQQHDQQYRRELRENSEWLRICVLETNMRRAGKLDGPGHAKIWLPARDVTHEARTDEGSRSSHRKVPPRWVAIYA